MIPREEGGFIIGRKGGGVHGKRYSFLTLEGFITNKHGGGGRPETTKLSQLTALNFN